MERERIECRIDSDDLIEAVAEWLADLIIKGEKI